MLFLFFLYIQLRKMLWQMKHDKPRGMAADAMYYHMSHDCRCDVMLHDGIHLVIVNTVCRHGQAVHLKENTTYLNQIIMGLIYFQRQDPKNQFSFLCHMQTLSTSTFHLTFSFETSRLMHVI